MVTTLIIIGILTIILFCAAIANMARMGKNVMEFEFDSFGGVFFWHCILGGLATLSSSVFVVLLIVHLLSIYA